MKALVPQAWEQKEAGASQQSLCDGTDRHYIALRTDIKVDDKLGTVKSVCQRVLAYAYLLLTRESSAIYLYGWQWAWRA